MKIVSSVCCGLIGISCTLMSIFDSSFILPFYDAPTWTCRSGVSVGIVTKVSVLMGTFEACGISRNKSIMKVSVFLSKY